MNLTLLDPPVRPISVNKQKLAKRLRHQVGQAIADFNRLVVGDVRVEQVLLPLRDGLTLIRRCT